MVSSFKKALARYISISLHPSLAVALVTWSLGAASCGIDDDRTPNWGTISPAIFQPNCATASCHSRATAMAGLDFSTRERGYRSLTGLKSSMPFSGVPRPLVTPFEPDQSRVVRMLRADSAPRMPPDRPLPEGDIVLIERWILNGAVDD